MRGWFSIYTQPRGASNYNNKYIKEYSKYNINKNKNAGHSYGIYM